MVLQQYAWEAPLMSLAFEGLAQATQATARPSYADELLSIAYDYCEEITAEYSRSFHMASALFPADKRRAARALYAFCRVSDDIVDRYEGDVESALSQWRQRVMSPTPPSDDLVAVAWADARARYAVPLQYAEQLIDGVARDLVQSRYQTFDDLAAYSYGVASTVGLMSMYITGFQGPDAIPYAVKLGVALQLTNILRDVGEDWRDGRLYLPLSELDAFGLDESDVAAGRVDGRWRAFMKFQIARARRLYEEAAPGIGLLEKDGRFAIAAAAGLYRGILDDIEAHDYDVFNRRAHIGSWGKLRRLPAIWWRSRRV